MLVVSRFFSRVVINRVSHHHCWELLEAASCLAILGKNHVSIIQYIQYVCMHILIKDFTASLLQLFYPLRRALYLPTITPMILTNVLPAETSRPGKGLKAA